MKQRNQRPSKGGRRGDVVNNQRRAVDKTMDNLSASSVVVTRKLTLATTLSTNGAGFIPATQITSDGARGANDWGSFAARYTQFRVKALRIRLVPIVDMTTATTVGGGAVTPHPTAIVFAVYGEGLGYGNYASILSGASAQLFNGREAIIEYTATWKGFVDAKLWSSTNAAIPTSQVFGVQFQDTGAAPASAATTVYYRLLTEWEVEFKFSE